MLRILLAKKNLSVKQFFTLYIATLAGLTLLYLGVTGRLHPLFVLLGAVLPFLARLMSIISLGSRFANILGGLGHMRPGAAGGKAPLSSEITTRFIHMVLFHDTGIMDGDILEGTAKGAKLSQLTLAQLLSLLAEIQHDADSCNLLAAYLDREHEGWRENDAEPASRPSEGAMTEAQALDILGLDEQAAREDIILAHRRMMQKVHPDRGGSTYLATKINAAKELLLETRG